MAQIHWTHKGNGNWTTASDWSSGTVPGASDDVFIGVNGATVTSDHTVTVNSIGTNTDSTLDISGKSWFTASNGTGSSENLGTINIVGDSTMQIGAGAFANYGTVLLGSTGYYNTFMIDNVVQLEGGGTIEMAHHTNGGRNLISGEVSYPNQNIQLDNVDNVIEGDGVITGLYFDNEANGWLEANSPMGALELSETNIAGQGFENEGHISAVNGGTLELFGMPGNAGFYNFGTIWVDSWGDATNLEIGGDVVLKGGGNVTLSGFTANHVYTNGTAATLENVDNVISGSGIAYDANLTLMNDAQGKIEADNANAALIIYTGGNDVINIGTLEAVNGASLQILSTLDNIGTFAANGGNAVVVGQLVGFGKTEIFSGSHIELMGTLNQASVIFENNTADNGVLILDHSVVGSGGANFKGTVAGLAFDGTNSDTLDLQDINFSSGVNWSFQENANGNRGVLTVNDGNGDAAKITLLGHYLAAGQSATSATSSLFHVAADNITNTTGTLVTTSFHS